MLPRPLIAISSVRLCEDVDAVRANLGRDLAQRAPEFGAGGARERARGVHDDRGDGAGHLAVTEPDAVGYTAREQPRLVKRVAEPLGGAAKSRRCATHNLFLLTGARTSSADRFRSRRRRGRRGAQDRCRRLRGAGPGAPHGSLSSQRACERLQTLTFAAERATHTLEPRGALHEAAFGSMTASSIGHG